MPRRRVIATQLGLWMLALLVGCGTGSGDAENAKPQLPDWLTEEEGSADGDSGTESGFASNVSSGDSGSPAEGLRVGDQFPLKKFVEQELQQTAPNGAVQSSRSTIEIGMTIVVESIEPTRKKFRVNYDSVRYEHDFPHEHVEFDSRHATGQTPVAALAYRGMLNHGFAFWLDRSNDLISVEGFEEFLSQCLRDVPDEHRTAFLGSASRVGLDGVADFIDETIGMIPPHGEPQTGAQWEQSRQLSHPVPMGVHNTCTIREVTPEAVTVAVRGEISSSPSDIAMIRHEPVRIRVTGGSTAGRCILSRRTGLPLHSQVERIVEMRVEVSPTVSFHQQKRVTTRVEGNLGRSDTVATTPAAPGESFSTDAAAETSGFSAGFSGPNLR